MPTLDERWQANGRAVTQHRKAVGMKVVRMKAALMPAAPTVRQATVLRSQPHDSRQLACHTAARTALLVLCLCLRGVTAHAVEATAAAREFAVTILPLLEQKCLGCHGGDPTDIKGEYRVDSRAHLLAGGESGDAAVIPGMPEQGSLLGALRWDSLEMPPKENDRLTSEQIDAVSRWIAAGAPWPDAEEIASYRAEALQEPSTAAGVLVATSGGTSDAWTMRRYAKEDLWPYQPVLPPTEAELHSLLQATGSATEDVSDLKAVIDALVTQRITEAGLPTSPRADARTLIRRATFDLHGLPPTPEAIAAFELAYAEAPEQAWSSLIDRLLESPRYGEHWGRHWLDVTRYADTGGMSNDYERSNMWRYRDYVIRSFHNDTPYNEFVIEQIAGDELADASWRSRTGGSEADLEKAQLQGDFTAEEAEWIVATGFLRLGPWDNAMVEEQEARQIWLDDLVNITGQTFLATTMRCVKCHDHKFDPIPTRDYYRMYAAFSATHMAERPAPFLPEENQDGFTAGREHTQRMLDFAVAEKTKLVEKREAAAREWFEEHGLPYKDVEERKPLPDEEKPARAVGLTYVDEGQLKVREQDEWIWTRRLERYEPMAQSVFNAAASKLAWNGARALRIRRIASETGPPECHILSGGALTAPADRVAPGVLSAVGLPVTHDSETPFLLTDSVDGRRLGLAQWIASPDNSLATRSIVNRLWQWHFGTGLAANANNFGGKGGKPSHPQLLDLLTDNFVRNGWTFKRMHRLIMQTETYQRSSHPIDAALSELEDPNNRLLSYFPTRRLTAEELRDGILEVTGELQHRLGGLPVMPEINMEVALQPRMIQFSLAPAYQPSADPDVRNSRSIYAYQVRGQADPFVEMFNLPSPNESCELRESASVTPQALTLLNSDQMTDRSIAFARRLEREASSTPAQIDRGFLLALGRLPTDVERTRLESYVADMTEYHRHNEPQPVTYPVEITRSLVEEFSGQPFEYQEILPTFENYTPDLKAGDVSAETRALADACLLLLNTNEFLYLD